MMINCQRLAILVVGIVLLLTFRSPRCRSSWSIRLSYRFGLIFPFLFSRDKPQLHRLPDYSTVQLGATVDYAILFPNSSTIERSFRASRPFFQPSPGYAVSGRLRDTHGGGTCSCKVSSITRQRARRRARRGAFCSLMLVYPFACSAHCSGSVVEKTTWGLKFVRKRRLKP